MSSADWMTRNIFNRVELAFPIIDKKLAQTILRDGLELYLKDNVQAWLMETDGRYVLADQSPDDTRVSAQDTLLRLMKL